MDKKLVVWFNKLCGSNVGSALTTSMGQLILSAQHKDNRGQFAPRSNITGVNCRNFRSYSVINFIRQSKNAIKLFKYVIQIYVND